MSAHALNARDNSVSLHTRLNADMSAPYMPQLLPPLLQALPPLQQGEQQGVQQEALREG